jgi:hypothetical protein
VLLVALDVWIRAARLTGTRRPSRAAMREVREARWTPKRMAAAGGALLSFYITYLSYRNLKGTLPLLRPGELFDRQLAEIDRDLFAGNDPAELLHGLLGTGGLPTHVLSTFYAAFIVFLPLCMGLALVFSRDLSTSLFFVTALSLNWLFGIASYFLLPALGPVYADPGVFADLPYSEVTRLQEMLRDHRIAYLRNPDVGTPQAIAAFASLHIAMSVTPLAAAYMLGPGPPGQGGAVGLAGHHRRRDDLPRLALRRRRHRGRRDRAAVTGAGAPADQLRRARRAGRSGPRPRARGPGRLTASAAQPPGLGGQPDERGHHGQEHARRRRGRQVHRDAERGEERDGRRLRRERARARQRTTAAHAVPASSRELKRT